MEENNIKDVANNRIKTDEINQYFVKDEFEEISNLERIKFIFEEIIDSLYLLRCLCCFTALLTTVAILKAGIENSFSEWTLLFLIAGYISVLIACPNRIIQFFCNSVMTGFDIGLNFFKIGCVFGAAIGIVWALFVILSIPAFVITIPYFIFVLRFY